MLITIQVSVHQKRQNNFKILCFKQHRLKVYMTKFGRIKRGNRETHNHSEGLKNRLTSDRITGLGRNKALL